MAFTEVKTKMAIAFAGMLADNTNTETDSYVNEEASDEMAFGTLVKEGAVQNGALILDTPATDITKLAGIVRHQHAYAKDTELGTIGLKPKTTLGILKRGKIYVTVDAAVTPLSAVRVYADTNAGAVGAASGPGTFCTIAVANHTINCSKFMKFRGTTTGAGVVELAVDMTGSNDAVMDP